MSQDNTTQDEQHLAAIVGDAPAPYSVKVVVADYNPLWPAWFAEEADKIRAALGDVALRIEHVGSTSVPGLAAKPIIDIALAVPDSSQDDTYVPALVAAGYDLQIREPEFHEHRCFYTRLERGHTRNVNLHTYTAGCVELDTYTVFRDWLRTHDDDRLLYQTTKQELAKRDWKYVQNYADAKTGVIEEIKARAGAPDYPCPVY
ncbi:GrpB family protein [Kibdelosporangium persicum]|uniref:Cyclopropane fatty acid synthase/methyltransferase n=1 Tax=Kibdelosporangium persicum TaxID=2698649 RepID=A0ABX2EZ62_9PSEU|nr:GrpB family protein [Kibdelosporangium persicum]NRN64346.1 Cyclopropane fatty acid synthase/methyltransferase [Kibdelosporangium persicum]